MPCISTSRLAVSVRALGAPRPSSKSLTFLLGCTFRKHSFQRKVAGRRWVPVLSINLCLGEWWCSSSLHRRRTKQTHGRPSHAYQAEDEWKRARRSCGSKRANPKTCLPRWRIAGRRCSPMWIAAASASVISVYCAFMTPARRGRDAGAACNYAGTASRSQPTQLANACGLTNDHVKLLPAFDTWR